MAEKIKYKATNIETGEVLVGDVDELSALLYASTGAIYRSATKKTHLFGEWKIERLTFKASTEKKNCPSDFSRRWDAVTKPFKIASRKAGNKNATIS